MSHSSHSSSCFFCEWGPAAMAGTASDRRVSPWCLASNHVKKKSRKVKPSQIESNSMKSNQNKASQLESSTDMNASQVKPSQARGEVTSNQNNFNHHLKLRQIEPIQVEYHILFIVN